MLKLIKQAEHLRVSGPGFRTGPDWSVRCPTSGLIRRSISHGSIHYLRFGPNRIRTGQVQACVFLETSQIYVRFFPKIRILVFQRLVTKKRVFFGQNLQRLAKNLDSLERDFQTRCQRPMRATGKMSSRTEILKDRFSRIDLKIYRAETVERKKVLRRDCPRTILSFHRPVIHK